MSTATETPQDLEVYTRETAEQARAASQQLTTVSGAVKNRWLTTAAERIRSQTDDLLAANQKDIEAAPQYGLTEAQIDRLRLSPERLAGIAGALEELVMLPDPKVRDGVNSHLATGRPPVGEGRKRCYRLERPGADHRFLAPVVRPCPPHLLCQ